MKLDPIIYPAISRLLGAPRFDWLARLFLVTLFPFSGIDKIIHWSLALQQANSSFLPGGPVLLIIGMTIEFICPLLILIRWYDGAAAALLALFCVVTAILYHDFWDYSGLLDPQGGPALSHFWDFLKNFSVAGGLLLVTRESR